MKPYAQKRCANPHAYYRLAQDVLEDEALSEEEKAHVLDVMAAQAAYLTDSDATARRISGAAMPLIWQMDEDAEPFHRDGNTQLRDVVACLSTEAAGDRAVARAARTVANLTGATVHFLNVLDDAPKEICVRDADGNDLRDAIRARRRALDEFAAHEPARNPAPHTAEVRPGALKHELLAAAAEHGAGLIIVSGADAARVADLLGGAAPCPVLVLPADETSARD